MKPQTPISTLPAEHRLSPMPAQRWWHYGHMWLVVGGPLTVVVASLVTGWIAMRGQDPVLSPDYYRQGLEINRTLEKLERQGSLAPALSARNHAATPDTAPGSSKPAGL